MLNETLLILKQSNIRLNKRKGQNYLINREILNKILESAELSSKDVVLDIGAGIGTLTIPLAQQVEHVIAIEQDKYVASVLEKRLEQENIANVTIFCDDVLNIALPPFNKVVSNLPYQISSPITFKLLDYTFDFGILMYQLEFAQRMVAKPGERNYSRLSVTTQLLSDVELLFMVPKSAFIPQPKISSAVIKLKPIANPRVDEFFLKTCRALFQHKRKKSKKALIESFHEIASLDQKQIREIVNHLNPYLMEERVFKLQPEQILMIVEELKMLL